MAAGDIIWFEQAFVDTDEGIHDKESDTFKYALADSTVTPTASLSDPRWGTGGGTDLSTNEVTAGGNYTAGGITIANPTATLASGKSRWDADDISILQDAGNPTDARWAYVYNDTDTGKRVIFAVDLGAVSDLTAGDFSNTWNANGIAETGIAA